jgi:hypothetical protein
VTAEELRYRRSTGWRHPQESSKGQAGANAKNEPQLGSSKVLWRTSKDAFGHSNTSLAYLLYAFLFCLGREVESRNGGRIYPRIQSLGTSPAQHGSKLENKSAQFVSPRTKAHERV